MTFGEKLMSARLKMNLSQLELGDKVGVTERSIYAYEQTSVLPRKAILQKLAETLRVSVTYLTDEGETDRYKDLDTDLFLDNAKKEFGLKGAREAQEVISRASALFAGGELDDDAKEIFMQSIMEVYNESKKEVRDKYSPRLKASPKK